MVNWYKDDFFYYGCAMTILGKVTVNHFMIQNYVHGLYKWPFAMAIGGGGLHLLNEYKLRNMQRKLEMREGLKSTQKITALGKKEGQQLGDYEDEIKRVVRRINY